ncbi:hypothetical protein SAMN05216570_1417 [Dyella sp. OK004]|uniref:hypothetical protein n=1 Tax=Dyella sp. OK004 TaxID=1855292 RepID=UPI0008F189F6|nr:hypothetical protein [Dyella sp. OK004]SFS00300.1 hypothetical protein SAMN05216570_1417 [Dyella sp. OK004]
MNSALGLFTAFHTVISVVAILAGIGAVRGLFLGRVRSAAMATFLVSAIVTTVTGFMFPYHGFTPAIGVGVIALLVLAWALLAQRRTALSAGSGAQFAVAIVVSEYFLVFVLVAQTFAKLPALNALAPNVQQPFFGAVQLIVLIAFTVIAIRAARASKTRVTV